MTRPHAATKLLRNKTFTIGVAASCVPHCEPASPSVMLAKKQDLTQTELAARIGIAQSALSRIEAGRANLTLGTLQRVTGARALPLRLTLGTHDITLTAA